MRNETKFKHRLVLKSYIADGEIAFEKWFDSIEDAINYGEGLLRLRAKDGLLDYVDIYTQSYIVQDKEPIYKSTQRYYIYHCGSKEFSVVLYEGDYDE